MSYAARSLLIQEAPFLPLPTIRTGLINWLPFAELCGGSDAVRVETAANPAQRGGPSAAQRHGEDPADPR